MAWGAVVAAAGIVYDGYKEKRAHEAEKRAEDRAQKRDAKENAEYLAYLRSSRLANSTSPLSLAGMDTGGLFSGFPSVLLIGTVLLLIISLLVRR